MFRFAVFGETEGGAIAVGGEVVGAVGFVAAAVEAVGSAVEAAAVAVAAAVVATADVVAVVAQDSNSGWDLVGQEQYLVCSLVGGPVSFGPVLQHFLKTCKRRAFSRDQKEKVERRNNKE